ncbi:Permease of the drug/metabolite transporter (DMT) superfamily [Noviherbaspirillum humi]|uniref:Permease of the drug/metabolite transporter (DMT) superfamily n=1 Tax=Noviherbaspirillum humi TaxID=1688639 RepID=A0A239K1W9_9BURK|nr:DMT family transporter [Noviherbaspirillum humi]SNT11663.1 Permease of the drug/metabolite transporter (DMT) superfamily [Noviherbaspirillum humi]
MPPSRKPPDAFAMSTMIALCLLWGMQQVAVKLAAHDMSPVLQIGLRSALAALMVYGLMLWRREKFSLADGTLLPGLGAGLLFAIEFLCVSLGLEHTTASHMSVFLYTAPVFTVLGLHWLVPGERLGPLQWVGVGAAFAGIVVAFSGSFGTSSKETGDLLLGDAFGVLAGLFWGATTVLIRRSRLSEASPSVTLLYQLGSSGALLVLVAVLTGQAFRFSLTNAVLGSLFFQTVIIGFASFLVWFWLLRTYLASRITVFSFLTPLFGVAFGVLLLHDPVGLQFGAGALLVLAGIILVNFKAKRA